MPGVTAYVVIEKSCQTILSLIINIAVTLKSLFTF